MTDIDATRAEEPAPDVQQFLEMYRSLGISLEELSPQQARQAQEQFMSVDSEIDVATVEDRTVEGPEGEIPVRLYDPREKQAETPLILYFHGGGWVVGSIDTHDTPCRKLAVETGWPVVSVDYRLAPEHPFPAALEDCYATLEWAAETGPAAFGIDADRLVLAGDSAGGNLATTVSMLARDTDGPAVAAQVLVYPVVGDHRDTDSFEQNREGYFLTEAMHDWFADLYLTDDIDAGNVYLRPQLSRDLSGLGPAVVVTAGFDILRDGGAEYARRLAETGIEVRARNYEAMIHGFFNMVEQPVDVDRAHDAHEFVATSLEELV